MAVRYAAHDRVIKGGRMVRVPTARNWTAEDYDLIERLIAQGKRYKDIIMHFSDPPVTPNALQKACEAAGIEYPHKAGRPRRLV